jgi:hypothetical protein
MDHRHAESGIAQPFKDGWDEYDFANLVSTDSTWAALYTEHESVEEYEASNFEADALDLISDPVFADHVLGYVYYRELWPEWASRGAIFYRLTPYLHQNPPEGIVQAVKEQIEPLVDEGMLTREGNYIKSGPHMPYDRFPQLEDEFEKFVHEFIAHCGGEALIRHITLEYFDKDDPTPYQFWAGHKACFRLAEEGAVEREWTHLRAKKVTSLGLIAVQDELSSQLGLDDVDKKLRQAKMTGKARMRKPQQRGRGW